jgi:hypothetical protein
MIYISHRGNISGRNPELENKPHYIDDAIAEGYAVEIDVWLDGKYGLCLGHDEPCTPVGLDWLLTRRGSLWIHCKNGDALNVLLCHRDSGVPLLNCFYHTDEAYVLTSKGQVWCYPGLPALRLNASINVCPEWEEATCYDPDTYVGFAGVCSDYVKEIKECLEK